MSDRGNSDSGCIVGIILFFLFLFAINTVDRKVEHLRREIGCRHTAEEIVAEPSE